MLKRAGSSRYQRVCNYGFTSLCSEFLSLTNYGLENIPKNEGITRIVPKKYQGILLPNLVVILSLRKPTKQVHIPSAIYPVSIDKPVIFSSK